MSWEIYEPGYRTPVKELKAMYQSLTDKNFAVSTIPYATISLFVRSNDLPVKLRRLKSGRVKVRLSQRLPQTDSQTKRSQNATGQIGE